MHYPSAQRNSGPLRFSLVLFAACGVFAVLLYFLMGEQLHYQASRSTIELPAAQTAAPELSAGHAIEQRFLCQIDRLEYVSVQWSAFYRTNSGTVTLSLCDAESGEMLLTQTFSASDIVENDTLTLAASVSLEPMAERMLALHITADSPVGAAAAPLLNGETALAGGTLTIDGQVAAGTLCFSAAGEDYTWIGRHYWSCAALALALLALYLFSVCYRSAAGKPTLLTSLLGAMHKYRFLICQLVDRDFKAKYKRSILGVFWSFLNPLLTMLVQYVVFSNLFRQNIACFPVYLLCGNIVFSYFSEACGMSLTSIVGNAPLITKVYMPKYIYPLTRILSSLINMLISLMPVIAAALLSARLPTKAWLLLPIPLLCLALFCLGMGLFLSAAMVFFRDVQFLWSIVTMIWMYLTPIFYEVSALPAQVQMVVRLNPLYAFVTFVRTCIISGVSPEPMLYLQCALSALLMLVVGAFVFKKTQDSFVLYL